MSVDAHGRAARLIADATRLEQEGKSVDARISFFQAAENEHEAFQLIPSGRRKTRGIVAVTAISCYRQAGALARARERSSLYLTADIPEVAREEIRSLLAAANLEVQASPTARSFPRSQGEWSSQWGGLDPQEIRTTWVGLSLYYRTHGIRYEVGRFPPHATESKRERYRILSGSVAGLTGLADDAASVTLNAAIYRWRQTPEVPLQKIVSSLRSRASYVGGELNSLLRDAGSGTLESIDELHLEESILDRTENVEESAQGAISTQQLLSIALEAMPERLRERLINWIANDGDAQQLDLLVSEIEHSSNEGWRDRVRKRLEGEGWNMAATDR